MGAELGVTQAVLSSEFKQLFLQTLFLTLNFQQSFRFLSVSFALCVVALCSWSGSWLRERLALLMEDVSEGTELQKYHLVQGFNSHKTVCHVCPTVHLLIYPWHREGGNHAWNYFLIRPFNSVFNFLLYKEYLRWWMMLMSIFEIKILLCVDSTFGYLKLLSP